jgi:geranylgeranyl pyrophosphate synthase
MTTDLMLIESPMLDDSEDGSDLRRGKPSAHTKFGAGPTVNSTFFHIVLAVKEIEKLNNLQCLEILLGRKTPMALLKFQNSR